MKKLIFILLMLVVMNVTTAQERMALFLTGRNISGGILSYYLVAVVYSGHKWKVGNTSIKINISPNPIGSLTVHPDNPVLDAFQDISGTNGYLPIQTVAESPTILSFNIQNTNINEYYSMFPLYCFLGKVRFNIVSYPFIADSTKFRVNPPFTTSLITIYDSTESLVYPNDFIVYQPPINIQNISTETPSKYSLSQNYPNPFNSMCNVQFSMCNAGNVKLVVYDVQGREVQTLVNERLQPGTYEAKFDGSMLNSGVYFYKLVTDGFTETKKMLMIK